MAKRTPKEELVDQFARAVQYGDLALALELGKRLKAMRDEAAQTKAPTMRDLRVNCALCGSHAMADLSRPRWQPWNDVVIVGECPVTSPGSTLTVAAGTAQPGDVPALAADPTDPDLARVLAAFPGARR